VTGSRQYLDGRSRGWAARLTSHGERLWEKQWSASGSLAEGFTDVVTTDASSIYVVGSARPNQETSRTVTAAIVLRIDANGELIWSKSLVLGTDAHAQAVAASRDGTIIVAGSPYIGVQYAAIPEFQGIATTVGQQFAAALTGTMTVDAALAAAQSSTQREMSRAGYPK
jgi:outer membrane protein assembly factor BamB